MVIYARTIKIMPKWYMMIKKDLPKLEWRKSKCYSKKCMLSNTWICIVNVSVVWKSPQRVHTACPWPCPNFLVCPHSLIATYPSHQLSEECLIWFIYKLYVYMYIHTYYIIYIYIHVYCTELPGWNVWMITLPGKDDAVPHLPPIPLGVSTLEPRCEELMGSSTNKTTIVRDSNYQKLWKSIKIYQNLSKSMNLWVESKWNEGFNCSLWLGNHPVPWWCSPVAHVKSLA